MQSRNDRSRAARSVAAPSEGPAMVLISRH
jgi:hypothetical protein